MKFLHTADWQIGMKASHAGEASKRVRDQRVETMQKVLNIAKENNVEFVLVAGDIFEDNGVDRVTVQRTADILAESRLPIYMIPGNHDPLVPGSVWDHPVWKTINNVNVMREEQPVEIPGGLLYPCPIHEKYSDKDPTAWISVQDEQTISIGLAHGTMEGIPVDEPDYPIPQDAPKRTGLTYLALGHWHSTCTYKGSDGQIRMAYSGTHEISRFGEKDSGAVLIVEINSADMVPKLTQLRTGVLEWATISHDVTQPGDVASLHEDIIKRISNPPSCLLELHISGIVNAEDCEDVERLKEVVASRFLYGNIDISHLNPAPNDESWIASLPLGVIRETGVQLQQWAHPDFTGKRPDGASYEMASVALMELYALTRGGGVMIVRSIETTNWRCHIGTIGVGPFQDRINVLYAPNATGKSAVFESLRRGLMDGHLVAGKEVETLRPWGRSLAPEVTIEFSHNGTDYCLTKRFLDEPLAKLKRKENGQFVAFANGHKADQIVRDMISQNPPGRGLSRPEHWGIAQVLWVPQDQHELTGLGQDLLANIRSSLGSPVSGIGGGLLEKRIEDVYLSVYTPKGSLRTGKEAAEITHLQDQLAKTNENHRIALQKLQQFQELSRRVEELRSRRVQAKFDVQSILDTLSKQRKETESYNTLIIQKSQRESEAKAAEATYSSLKSCINGIKSANDELNDVNKVLVQLRDQLPLQKRELSIRGKEEADIRANIEDIRKERQDVEDKQRVADDAREYTVNTTTISNLRNQLSKIISAQERLVLLKEERSGLVTPSKKTLSAIREATKKRDETQILIDSALITLEIVPVNDGSLEIIEAEQAGILDLQAGTPTKLKGSPQVIADIPGFARLRASGPSGSIQEHKTALSNAQQSIMDLMKPFSTENIEDLERMVEDDDKLDKKIVAINTELKTILCEQTLEEIRQQETHLKSIQAKILLNYPKWKHNSPDPNAMKMAAEEHRRDFINRIDAAETTHTTAVSTLNGINEEVTKTAAKLETEGYRAKSLEKRIEELKSDGKSDVERQKELDKAALSWHSSNAGLQEVENKLGIFLDDPQLTAARLEKQLEAANDVAKTMLEDEKTAEGQLQIIATQGPYSALAEIEEGLITIECRLETERSKTNAVKLLYNTMIHNRAEMLSTVTKPVEIAATRTMHRIAGEKLGRLLLSSDLAPTHIIPSGLETPVPIESLSGGEKEQIHLATRLALADVLARDNRQMVVLDDVLYVTDAGRFARVLNIIEEETLRLQIIILTCHPEKYRGLGDANFLDMETAERRV